MLVDLPGYGYAKASKQRIGEWSGLILRYLRGRAALRRVLVLVDSRVGLKDSDRDLFGLLDEIGVSYQIVLTKKDDKPKIDDPLAGLADELARHPAAHPEIIATSSREGTGIPELRASLTALAAR